MIKEFPQRVSIFYGYISKSKENKISVLIFYTYLLQSVGQGTCIREAKSDMTRIYTLGERFGAGQASPVVTSGP